MTTPNNNQEPEAELRKNYCFWCGASGEIQADCCYQCGYEIGSYPPELKAILTTQKNDLLTSLLDKLPEEVDTSMRVHEIDVMDSHKSGYNAALTEVKSIIEEMRES